VLVNWLKRSLKKRGWSYIESVSNLRLRNELAAWINKFDWQFFVTGTFKPELSYKNTINTKGAFHRWLRVLGVDYGKHDIQYFMAVERFKSGDFTHIHALVNGLDGLTYRQIGESWRTLYGMEKVVAYDKRRGAGFYLTKYVTKDLCDWDLRLNKSKNSKLII